MRKKIIGAICVVIGAIGIITIEILDSKGSIDKELAGFLKCGYGCMERYSEICRGFNHIDTNQPMYQFRINEKIKHLNQSVLHNNYKFFTIVYGRDETNKVRVNNPAGNPCWISISHLDFVLNRGYTLCDESLINKTDTTHKKNN